MGFMAMDYFRQSPLLAMPVIALVIFMLVFLAVSLRALLTQKSSWDAAARLPLSEGQDSAGVEEKGHE
ncbi:MAG: hypothetical protein RLZZ450_1948 [Pseudomonadota bacterium]|jgi:cbb3-type cytochrome oxidase subunit 3